MKETAEVFLEDILNDVEGENDPASVWLTVHVPALIEDCKSNSLYMREKLDLACLMLKWKVGEERNSKLSDLEACRDLFMDYHSLEASGFVSFLKRTQEAIGYLHSSEATKNFSTMKGRLKDFRILLSTLVNRVLKREYEKIEDVQEDFGALLDEFFQLRHFLRSKPTFINSDSLRGALEKARNLLAGAAREFEDSRC